MASMSAKSNLDVVQTIGAHRLAKFGVVAAITTSVGNVLILFISLAVGEFPAEFVGGAFGPLAVGPVVMNSTVAAFGATLVFGMVTRYAARPARTFTTIAGAILILSLAMFLAPDMADAPLSVFTVLAVMHVAAAVTIVGVLTQTLKATSDPEAW